MLLPFKYGIPKQLYFEKEEAFVTTFLELFCMLSSADEGRVWTSASVLAPQQKVMGNLSPGCIAVHRWNERNGTEVFYH